MKLIKNNPYRTIGILVGATAREKERQIKRLRQFIEAEEKPQDDFSFPILGQFQRTIESVSYATSRLNLDEDKMIYALFWFYKGSDITDEPAFDSLKDGDLESATEMWTKLITTGEVTQRNCSAFQNLSTLLLSNLFNGTQINVDILDKGISLKLKFLESNFVKDFKALATDETYKTSKNELQLTFLNYLLSEIDSNGVITAVKIFDLINRQDFSAKEEFLKNYVQKSIEQIEKKIGHAKTRRRTNNAEGAKAGEELHLHTIEIISQLRTMLGSSNIKFSSTSDKVANEILQCGIDYFKFNRNSSENTTAIPKDNLKYFGVSSTENFVETTMDLFRKAKSLAFGNIALERCTENIDGLQEWIEEKPNREKRNTIKEELSFITNSLKRLETLDPTFEIAKNFVITCKDKLREIKNKLGSSDDLYLNVSSSVVQNAQNILLAIVNGESEKLKNASGFLRLTLPPIQIVIMDALDITFIVGCLDMHYDIRQNYIKNLADLKSIADQLGVSSINPKVNLQDKIRINKALLKDIQSKVFLKSEIDNIQYELKKNDVANYYKKEIDAIYYEIKKINRWKFFKGKTKREYQNNMQKQKINDMLNLNEKEKTKRKIELESRLEQLLKRSEFEKVNEIKVKKQEIANLQVLLDQYL